MTRLAITSSIGVPINRSVPSGDGRRCHTPFTASRLSTTIGTSWLYVLHLAWEPFVCYDCRGPSSITFQ